MRGGKLYALVLSSIVSIAMSLPRLRNLLFVGLLLLVGGALLASYLLSWQPADREAAPLHCQGAAPALKPGQALKVMTWNIQYLAGKRYVFWDDLPDATGPDQRPTAEDLAFTLDEVVRVIRDEQPDLVLLQEIDDGSSATDDQDQLALIQERINDLYHCSAQAYEWKSAFVPTPHIFGSVGRKQATLSRYRIDSAERRQLPPRDGGLFDRLFGPRPAILVSHLPIDGGGELAVLNARFDRPQANDDTLERQVETTRTLLDELQARRTPWLLGGDLNLLPPGQYPYLLAPLRALPGRQRTGHPERALPDGAVAGRGQWRRPGSLVHALPQRPTGPGAGSDPRLPVPQPLADPSRCPGPAQRYAADLQPPAARRALPAAPLTGRAPGWTSGPARRMLRPHS